MNRNTLLILPALRAERGADETFLLTRKFVDGVRAYTDGWDGPVVVAVQQTEKASGNLDHLAVANADVPFQLIWADQNTVARMKDEVAVALVSVVDRLMPVVHDCANHGLPTVLVAEYSYETRNQIIRTETSNPLLQWRRMIHNMGVERRFRKAVGRSTGLQCNGTPTFDAWRPLSTNPLLYFDTRVDSSMLASDEQLQQRTATMMTGGPLRLAFSGRWSAMKGPDHLIPMACELRTLGVDFRLDICGGGVLAPTLEEAIQDHALQDIVHLRGVLDFHDELVPFIANEVDLFVCCHRQGDPSCTYLETMSCGTPIVGYANEAFEGIAANARIGWTSPLDDPHALAHRIAWLEPQRQLLAESAWAARAFAAHHTFEHTMQRRLDHLRSCCRQYQAGAVA